MKVILDSNFLIDILRFKLDLDNIKEICGRCELIVFDSVVDELEKISKSKGKNGQYARLALKILKLKNIKILKIEGKDVDETILNFVNRDMVVATNDRELRKKLKVKDIKTIYIRNKKRMVMEWVSR